MRVVAFGERQNEIMRLRRFRGGFDLHLCSLWFAEVDILADRAAEQRRFLQHNPDMRTK